MAASSVSEELPARSQIENGSPDVMSGAMDRSNSVVSTNALNAATLRENDAQLVALVRDRDNAQRICAAISYASTRAADLGQWNDMQRYLAIAGELTALTATPSIDAQLTRAATASSGADSSP